MSTTSSSKKDKAKARRAQVPNACISCRTAKLKCSGGHPICSRCNDRGIECTYDVGEGMTKRQQLRLDLSDQRQELDRAMAILHYLRKGSDQEATETLARLRIGQSVDAEYHRIQARISAAAQDENGSGGDNNNIGHTHNNHHHHHHHHHHIHQPYHNDNLDPSLDAEVAAQNHRLMSLMAAARVQNPQTQTQTTTTHIPPAWDYQSRPPDGEEGWMGYDDYAWEGHQDSSSAIVDSQGLAQAQDPQALSRRSPPPPPASIATHASGAASSSFADSKYLYHHQQPPPSGSQ